MPVWFAGLGSAYDSWWDERYFKCLISVTRMISLDAAALSSKGLTVSVICWFDVTTTES